MAPPSFDLNLDPPDPELNDPIDWSAIGDWEGPANGLEYDMVWHDENEEEEEDEAAYAVDLNMGMYLLKNLFSFFIYNLVPSISSHT